MLGWPHGFLPPTIRQFEIRHSQSVNPPIRQSANSIHMKTFLALLLGLSVSTALAQQQKIPEPLKAWEEWAT